MQYVHKFVSLILLYVVAANCDVSISDSDPVIFRNFSISEFVNHCGYPFEVHQNLETSDGYLLDIHRIPRGKINQSEENRPVILLMHGLLGSAENFLILGCERALAFALADRGFDVWLGNARGTIHSRKHSNLNPDKDNKFWYFSWHEIGVYDIPAIIDYIRNFTKQEQIFYSGHSQGTTSFFVMTAEKPEYNQYIKIMMAMAPAVYMGVDRDTSGKDRRGFMNGFISQGIAKIIEELGMEELRPSKNYMFCVDLGSYSGLCPTLKEALHLKEDTLELDVLRRAQQTFPAGASMRQIIHFAQGLSSGRFCKYDHGNEMNMELYGSSLPPLYNISKITVPVGIFYSKQDRLTAAENVERLADDLPNLIFKYPVPSSDFSHFDFVVSADAFDLVYQKFFSELEKYL